MQKKYNYSVVENNGSTLLLGNGNSMEDKMGF